MSFIKAGELKGSRKTCALIAHLYLFSKITCKEMHTPLHKSLVINEAIMEIPFHKYDLYVVKMRLIFCLPGMTDKRIQYVAENVQDLTEKFKK